MSLHRTTRLRYSRYLVLGFSLGAWGARFLSQQDEAPYAVCTTGLKNARIICLRLPNKGTEGPENLGYWRLCVEVDKIA
jgi:hypothetical protein